MRISSHLTKQILHLAALILSHSNKCLLKLCSFSLSRLTLYWRRLATPSLFLMTPTSMKTWRRFVEHTWALSKSLDEMSNWMNSLFAASRVFSSCISARRITTVTWCRFSSSLPRTISTGLGSRCHAWSEWWEYYAGALPSTGPIRLCDRLILCLFCFVFPVMCWNLCVCVSGGLQTQQL